MLYFIKLIKFDKNEVNSKASKCITKVRDALLKELKSKQALKINFEHAQEESLGCLAQCFFCGARCMATVDCTKSGSHHKTTYHRPMAFKGSYEKKKVNGVEKKVLLQDFCTSTYNFE